MSRDREDYDPLDEVDDRRERGGSRRERSRSKDRRSKKEHKSKRDRSRSRERRRSRSRDRRRRSRSRSRSRDRERRRRSSYSRSRSRDRYRRSSKHRDRSRSRSMTPDGGYRPRKRQEEPKAAASMFATNDPFAHLRSKQPMDPQEAMRLWQEQMLKSRQLVLAQQAKSAVQQANKAQRELYIGNLAAGQVTEGMLQQVFNSALIAAFPDAGRPGQEPVIKANIHSDGRYGFIEFRSAEYATAALELNGQINLMNQALSIGRPASYVDPNKVNAAAAQAEAALTAFQQGLPLPPSAVGLPAALTPGSTGAAMAAAGNLAAGGHNAAAGVPVLPSVLPGVLPGIGGLLGGTGLEGLLPTPYVAVNGMISGAVLQDDDEYEEVLLDLREECDKYGVVTDVVVPRPDDPKQAAALLGTANYGKAFVAFKDAVESAKARERINGRMFAGQMVTVAYISQQQFEAVRAATDPAAAAAAAEHVSAAVAAVGLVSHGSPSPERIEEVGQEEEGATTAAAGSSPVKEGDVTHADTNGDASAEEVTAAAAAAAEGEA